jgi:hypothetical protein
MVPVINIEILKAHIAFILHYIPTSLPLVVLYASYPLDYPLHSIVI